ncbi:MAG: formate dehydrogenase accessory sulfurtransferase FdhD [Caldilineales bacterium]|nr:formate dehydrogenase accessory sulfurtransferase FdhD [Caldilineales bacterium]MCW5860694.1 formate dehydrogenase accessory sulfurtransferase FdhD [Caldilineales bacterium]
MLNDLPTGALPVAYHLYERGRWAEVNAAIVEETSLCIHVNGQELATYQCSPLDQEAMALGFLRSEGLIAGLEDIAVVELSGRGTCVDVWLKKEVELPQRRIKTTGCGEGVTFDDLSKARAPLNDELMVAPERIFALYEQMSRRIALYPLTRGIHASALCSPEQALIVAEDVGRHNTLDKLWGKAMQQGISVTGRIIVTTGRISSEMLGKAAKMGVGIIASRTSPTSRSTGLARAWNITVVGYLRRESMRVYSAPQRLCAPGTAAPLSVTVPPSSDLVASGVGP